MMTYLLKFILCSGLLYAFYHLILRNERLFRFNRFFLLSIVVLSGVIPLITVKTSIVEVPAAQSLELIDPIAGYSAENSSLVATFGQPLDTAQYLSMAYIAITGLLLIRFSLNLWSLNRFKKGGKVIHNNGVSIVLRSDITHSFSFLNHIYTHRESFERGGLPAEIIAHERAHIHQRHSYDILFAELMVCLCWFNPVVLLIKRAIQLNHEFLADEAVISETGALVRYQNIIINFASQQMIPNPRLVSHLSFGETKKRITIMAKTQNKMVTTAKQITATLVIAMLFISLGKTKVIAQESAGKIITTAVPFLTIKPEERSVNAQDTKQDNERLPAPPIFIRDMLQAKSKVRYTDANDKVIVAIFEELPASVQKDITELKLNIEIHRPPTPHAPISQDMLDDFKDTQRYGVWIDGSRVENIVLNNHKPEDFHHYFKSRLSTRAKNYGQYTYHLTLVTQKAFEKVSANIDGRWIAYTTLMAKARKLVKHSGKDQH